jgi:syntaxin 16
MSVSSLGTVRDRTHKFVSLRERGKKFSSASVYNEYSVGETAGLLGHGGPVGDGDLERGPGSSGGERDDPTLSPRSHIQADMASIRSLMEDIRVLHGKASLNTFDDARVDEVAVEVATEKITSLFRSCEKNLLACNNLGPSVSHVEKTIQNNMQKTLALELQKLSLDFRKQQKTYLIRLRERDGRKSTAANALGVIDNESNTGTFLSEMQTLAVDNAAAVTQERDREVVKIVASIHDLGQIMKDLSTLVIEQGTILDRIDCTLQQTSSVVDQGVSQLKRAEKSQRRGILASCVLILCAMIAFLFVILIIKSIL